MKYKDKFIPLIIQWLFSTNHKVIGTLYIFLSLISGLIGTLLSVVIGIQLALLGYCMMNYHTYNVEVVALFPFIISFVVMKAFIGVLNMNILVALLDFRIEDMSMHRLPLYTYSLFVTAVLSACAIAKLLTARNFNVFVFGLVFNYCDSLFQRSFVWAHHSYSLGLDIDIWICFTAATMIIWWVMSILKKQK